MKSIKSKGRPESPDYEAWVELEIRWQPVIDYADRRVEVLKNRLSDKGQTSSMEDVRAYQAELKVLESLRTLPDIKLKELETNG